MGLDNPLHIAIILIVVLMVFGAKRLPELGKSMGEGLRGFKESVGGERGPQAGNLHELVSADPQNASPVQADAHPSPAETDTHASPAETDTHASPADTDTHASPAVERTPAAPVA